MVTQHGPVAGIGQGNGTGPAIRAAVSSLLFEIMQEDRFLTQIICAMSSHEFCISGFAFVDDTDLCVSGSPTVEATIQHMQDSITHWEGLL